jgi:hypothetical protein
MTRAYNTATTQQNSGGAVAGVTAGKNLVINGAFDFWQRGTTFTNPGANTYGPDRWTIGDNTGCVYTRQSSDAPTGFQYFMRVFRTAGTSNTSNINVVQSIDTPTSIPFAGKTVTLSLYLRKGANGPSNLNIALVWGTQTDGSLWGGGGNGGSIVAVSQAITTSWTRYTYTATVPSNATQLFVWAYYAGSGTSPANEYFDITGVQLEVGNVATPFSRAAGTVQGEFAACQRYYQIAGDTIYEIMDGGYMTSGSVAYPSWIFSVPMRGVPTGTVVGSWAILNVGQPVLQASQQRGFCLRATSGTTGAYYFHSNTTYYLTFSAEI